MTILETDRKWLGLCKGQCGLYPGIHSDRIPSAPANRLYNSGFIRIYAPRNPDHKDRWVITATGEAALLEAELNRD
jgi:hypothetical protein